MTTEVDGRNVILSIDLSKNDEEEKEGHNHVIDVRELQQKFEELDYVQLHKDKWLEDGIRKIAQTMSGPALFWLEFLFKDGSKRSAPVLIKDKSNSFWIYLYQR